MSKENTHLDVAKLPFEMPQCPRGLIARAIEIGAPSHLVERVTSHPTPALADLAAIHQLVQRAQRG